MDPRLRTQPALQRPFAEIVSDDFSLLYLQRFLLIVQNRLRCGVAQFKVRHRDGLVAASCALIFCRPVVSASICLCCCARAASKSLRCRFNFAVLFEKTHLATSRSRLRIALCTVFLLCLVKFCSHHVALPAKMNFRDSAFIGRSRAKAGELDPGNSYATDHCYTDRTNGCHIPNACWKSRLGF